MAIYCFFARLNQGHEEIALSFVLVGGLVFSVLMAMGAYLTRTAEMETKDESRLLKIYSNLDINETLRHQMEEEVKLEQRKWHEVERVWECRIRFIA